MEDEAAFIIAPPRWNILQSITKGNTTPTSIAKHLNLSIAYITAQLKLLTAAGYLKQEKQRTNKVGKPRSQYTISKELVIIAAISSNGVNITQFKPQKKAQFIFNTLFQNNEQDLYYLQKFYYQYEDLINSTHLMALLENKQEEVHFLTISDNVEEIRKKYSNITLKNAEGKERKIVIWSHTKDEVEQGLKKKEEYYMEKVRKASAFWERGTTLEYYKKLLGANP